MHVDGKFSIDLSLVETILKIYTFPGACIEKSVVCMYSDGVDKNEISWKWARVWWKYIYKIH